jgi:hypothetical protein
MDWLFLYLYNIVLLIPLGILVIMIFFTKDYFKIAPWYVIHLIVNWTFIHIYSIFIVWLLNFESS